MLFGTASQMLAFVQQEILLGKEGWILYIKRNETFLSIGNLDRSERSCNHGRVSPHLVTENHVARNIVRRERLTLCTSYLGELINLS
jgi:hypothetical protein